MDLGYHLIWYHTLYIYNTGWPKTWLFFTVNNSGSKWHTAIYQIAAVFVGNKTAITINNLVVAHWLNIHCRCSDVKGRFCYKHTIRVNHYQKNWPQNSLDLNPVDFSVWGAIATEVVSLKVPRHWSSEVCSVKLLGSEKSGHNKWIDRCNC